jgi:hypothetical protein
LLNNSEDRDHYIRALTMVADHITVWPSVNDYTLLGKRSLLMNLLERIASVVTDTTRPSFRIISSNSSLDDLGDGVLKRDYSDISVPYSAVHGVNATGDPIDIRGDADGSWIWQSNCPQQEEFGELRVFIMGGRIALIIRVTQQDGKLHLERITEFPSLAEIR